MRINNKILVIDEPSVLRTARRMLEKENYVVDIAISKKDALSYFPYFCTKLIVI